MRLVAALLAALSVGALGCNDLPGVDLQRMKEQSSRRAYDPSEVFPDGRAMRPPVPGTVPRERVLGSTALDEGLIAAGGAEVTAFPLPLTRELLLRGRNRFEVYCAACHGLTGEGISSVAGNMDLRRPPSLVDDVRRGQTVGHLYRAATFGFGLMPSYAEELDVTERWAVVAYVRALQRATGAQLSSLPPTLRGEATAALQSHPPAERPHVVGPVYRHADNQNSPTPGWWSNRAEPVPPGSLDRPAQPAVLPPPPAAPTALPPAPSSPPPAPPAPAREDTR